MLIDLHSCHGLRIVDRWCLSISHHAWLFFFFFFHYTYLYAEVEESGRLVQACEADLAASRARIQELEQSEDTLRDKNRKLTRALEDMANMFQAHGTHS